MSITEVAKSFMSSVPAQFLMLIAINVVFLVALFWFLSEQQRDRTEAFRLLLQSCIQQRQTP